MRNIALFLSILIFSGCASKVTPPTDEPLVVVTTPDELIISCIHKYDSTLNFKYTGEAVVYKQELFGEVLYIFEYNTITGDTLHISNYDMVNYDCSKVK